MIGHEIGAGGRGSSARTVELDDVTPVDTAEDMLAEALRVTRLRESNLFDWTVATIPGDRARVTLHTD